MHCGQSWGGTSADAPGDGFFLNATIDEIYFFRRDLRNYEVQQRHSVA